MKNKVILALCMVSGVIQSADQKKNVKFLCTTYRYFFDKNNILSTPNAIVSYYDQFVIINFNNGMGMVDKFSFAKNEKIRNFVACVLKDCPSGKETLLKEALREADLEYDYDELAETEIEESDTVLHEIGQEYRVLKGKKIAYEGLEVMYNFGSMDKKTYFYYEKPRCFIYIDGRFEDTFKNDENAKKQFIALAFKNCPENQGCADALKTALIEEDLMDFDEEPVDDDIVPAEPSEDQDKE